MRQRRLRQALDDCLQALERGESLESCLSRYPDLASELRPLLLVAMRLRQVEAPRPRPAAQTSAWLKYSRRAAQMRAARMRRRWRWLGPAAIAASLILAVGLGLTATVTAASRSLPGDPLYRVKLLSEEAQVLVTWDRESRAELLLDQAEERVAEIQKVSGERGEVPAEALSALRSRVARASQLLAGRQGPLAERAQSLLAEQQALLVRLAAQVPVGEQDQLVATVASIHNARLRLAGQQGVALPAQSIAGGFVQVEGVARRTSEAGVWLIGQYRVLVDETTLVDAQLDQGKLVRVLAGRGTGPDATLRALTVAVVGAPGQEIIIRGVVQKAEGQELQVDDRLVRIASGAHVDTVTVGDTVQVRATIGSDGLVATEVRLLSGPMLVASVTVDGTADEDFPALQGQPVLWRVGGQQFRVTPQTAIDTQAGQPRKGSFVRVIAQRQGNDLEAQRVVVLAAAAPSTGSLWVQGVYQGSVNGKWIVGGATVDPPPGAAPPPEGALVRVAAVRAGNRVEARDAVVVMGRDQGVLVQVRGTIREIRADGSWLVGGTVVRLGPQAYVVGTPSVGAEVEVQGTPGDTGLQAVFVQVLVQPTPTPSPTPPPETPAPTPTPSPTPVPSPSPSPTPPSTRTAAPTAETSLPTGAPAR